VELVLGAQVSAAALAAADLVVVGIGEQAKTAARNMLGGAEPYARQPYFFTDQYDLGMEYFGHVGPHGYDTVVIQGDTKSAFRAYWERRGTVVAAMHANDGGASDELRASIGTASKG
jgi:hypothetical protein